MVIASPVPSELHGRMHADLGVPEHHVADSPSQSSHAKLNVAKMLYKQGMANRATRLVQDHRRRGLSPPIRGSREIESFVSP